MGPFHDVVGNLLFVAKHFSCKTSLGQFYKLAGVFVENPSDQAWFAFDWTFFLIQLRHLNPLSFEQVVKHEFEVLSDLIIKLNRLVYGYVELVKAYDFHIINSK